MFNNRIKFQIYILTENSCHNQTYNDVHKSCFIHSLREIAQRILKGTIQRCSQPQRRKTKPSYDKKERNEEGSYNVTLYFF